MRNVESISCELVNGSVRIFDQYGNEVNCISGCFKHAYSTGCCIIAETDSMIYTYRVRRDGSIERTATRGRTTPQPVSSELTAGFAKPEWSRETSSTQESYGSNYVPVPSSGSSSVGWGVILVLGCIVGLYKIFFSGGEGGKPSAAPASRQEIQQQASQSEQSGKSQPNVRYCDGNLRWMRMQDGGYLISVDGKYELLEGKGAFDFDNKGRPVSLVLRKRTGRHELFVIFDEKIVSGKMIIAGYGFDKDVLNPELLHEIECSPSEDSKGIFFHRDVIGLVNAMRNKSLLAVICASGNGGYYNGRLACFDIRRFFDKYIELEKEQE